jgi:hypothetical protein
LIVFGKHDGDIALTGKAGSDPRRILVGWNCDAACCEAFKQPGRSRMGVALQGFGPFSLKGNVFLLRRSGPAAASSSACKPPPGLHSANALRGQFID